MTAQLKRNLTFSLVTLAVPLYCFIVTAVATSIHDDINMAKEMYQRYVFWSDTTTSIVTGIVLALASSFFSFRTIYHADDKRFKALGLILMVVAILFAGLFTFWLM